MSHKNTSQLKERKIKVLGKFFDAETANEASEILASQYEHSHSVTLWPIEDETYIPIICSPDDEKEVQKALLDLGASKALTDPGSW
jgi:hypothetical protein